MSAVLVTGTARGIGHALTRRLAADGRHVIAAVRSESDLGVFADVAGPGQVTTIVLDVTNPDHVARLAADLPSDLTAIVNNAGAVLDGPVECISPDDLQRQFAINVTGAMAVTQQTLPLLRANRGRAVFVSSVSGRVSTPWTGGYSASKFALEGLVDALRIELKPWRVPAVLVEPGPTATDMWAGAADTVEQTVSSMTDEQKQLYAKHIEGARRMTSQVTRITAPTSAVVKTIVKALDAKHPRARYPVGIAARAQIHSATLTPTRILDTVLGTAAGVPRT